MIDIKKLILIEYKHTIIHNNKLKNMISSEHYSVRETLRRIENYFTWITCLCYG